jgi:hypothetical protein
MKSGFYYANPERENPIKMMKILFEYKITIKIPKNTIIILRATPSAAGPHSREEGCVVVAMLR